MILLCFGFLVFSFGVLPAGAFNRTSYAQLYGLVGYWSFDEGSGTAAKDGSGNNNNATLHGASWTKGKAWSALNFDGLNDYVDCGNNETLDPIQGATIEAWVNFGCLPSVAGHTMEIASRSGASTDLDLQAETDNRFKFYIGPGVVVASNTVVEIGRWYHVAATYQAYNCTRMYVNGILEKTTSINLARGTNPNSFSIGESLVWRGRYFNGTIDEVKVYNRPLSAEEVWSEYTRNCVSISPSYGVMDVGQSQQFDSSVSGGAFPYNYQWYLNDAPVSGATDASWTLTPSTPGSYIVYLNVTDATDASATSNTATISVNEALRVTISPTSVTMNVTESQLFIAEVSGGTPPYSFQWYLNDTAVPGANSTTWTFTPDSVGNYTIYVRVNDAVSSTAVPAEVGSVVVIVEFQPSMLLFLFMIITLLCAVIFKKKGQTR